MAVQKPALLLAARLPNIAAGASAAEASVEDLQRWPLHLVLLGGLSGIGVAVHTTPAENKEAHCVNDLRTLSMLSSCTMSTVSAATVREACCPLQPQQQPQPQTETNAWLING